MEALLQSLIPMVSPLSLSWTTFLSSAGARGASEVFTCCSLTGVCSASATLFLQRQSLVDFQGSRKRHRPAIKKSSSSCLLLHYQKYYIIPQEWGKTVGKIVSGWAEEGLLSSISFPKSSNGVSWKAKTSKVKRPAAEGSCLEGTLQPQKMTCMLLCSISCPLCCCLCRRVPCTADNCFPLIKYQ